MMISLPHAPPVSRLQIRSSSITHEIASASTTKRVVLVRHGQSTWNEEGRIQGSSDFSVLTNKGETQADISRQMLINDSFDVCFTSPLKRSKRTAEIIWGSRDSEMIPNYDLREIDLYSFQGLLKKEGKEKFGESFQQWQEDPANFKIDGHYPVRELWSRGRSCWNGILGHESKSVLVVAHNAVNQALIATAIGLGTEYFRRLLQSNCGVSVLDFTPRGDGGVPHVCLNRLNQTPNSPLASGTSGGRKSCKQIILVCNGQVDNEKTSELLLDVNVSSVVCSTTTVSIETARVISSPRNVKTKQMNELDVVEDMKKDEEAVSALWKRSGEVLESLLEELSGDEKSDLGNAMVVVGSPMVHMSLIAQCLDLTKEWLGLFHLDAGSISVIDFPDGSGGKGVIRCTNYTSHLGKWSVPITRPR